jgi:hypothetical protein
VHPLVPDGDVVVSEVTVTDGQQSALLTSVRRYLTQKTRCRVTEVNAVRA